MQVAMPAILHAIALNKEMIHASLVQKLFLHSSCMQFKQIQVYPFTLIKSVYSLFVFALSLITSKSSFVLQLVHHSSMKKTEFDPVPTIHIYLKPLLRFFLYSLIFDSKYSIISSCLSLVAAFFENIIANPITVSPVEVVRNKSAPCSNKNIKMIKFPFLAASCKGVYAENIRKHI